GSRKFSMWVTFLFKLRKINYTGNSRYSSCEGEVKCLTEVDGKTALHVAACFGHVRKYLICEKLIKYGANVELRTDKGWTPLHLASFKGHIEIIHLLKDSHAKLNAKGSMDWTPLHLATRYSDEPVVCELLRCGADPNIAEKSEWAPLHFAVQRGSFLTVINLLECKADVNAKNKVGWTPLHLAVLKGNMAIIKTLIKAGALLDVEDITGCTALQLAIRHQRENIITLLQDGYMYSLFIWAMLKLCIATHIYMSPTDFIRFIPCFPTEKIGVKWPWHRWELNHEILTCCWK
uniref:Uncharacterized protein n=1 Tax=Buteo japonicus TaxID=224669 RepID=A0A8C0B8Z2_9AVES